MYVDNAVATIDTASQLFLGWTEMMWYYCTKVNHNTNWYRLLGKNQRNVYSLQRGNMYESINATIIIMVTIIIDDGTTVEAINLTAQSIEDIVVLKFLIILVT